MVEHLNLNLDRTRMYDVDHDVHHASCKHTRYNLYLNLHVKYFYLWHPVNAFLQPQGFAQGIRVVGF